LTDPVPLARIYISLQLADVYRSASAQTVAEQAEARFSDCYRHFRDFQESPALPHLLYNRFRRVLGPDGRPCPPKEI